MTFTDVVALGKRRAALLAKLEELEVSGKAANERLDGLRRYRSDLGNELERITRTADAGAILADLKITHCPACDQPVVQTKVSSGDCFLCHQDLAQAPDDEELGAVRIRFEQDRLTAELEEVEDLAAVLEKETKQFSRDMTATRDELTKVHNELQPAREAVAALVQEEISAIDMALGEANERQSHFSRVTRALAVEDKMSEGIAVLKEKLAPIQERIEEAKRAIDFDARAALLEDGMNAYLSAINELRPNVWRHNPVGIDLSSSSFTIRVGRRRWNAVLGGTDTLYFLMAYHYGLLSLSAKDGCHYPGLSIIDVPGEFSGEEVKDKENFIVQPFVDLLGREEYVGTQLIISGASFSGLQAVHRRHLDHVYVA